MQPTNDYLWRISGEALAICYRAAPGYEAHLTPGASMIFSGEGIPDLNFIIVDDCPAAEQLLREYILAAAKRKLPAIVLITRPVIAGLKTTISELGLQYLEEFPLMVYSPENPTADTGDFQVWRAENEPDIRKANDLMSTAFSIEAAALNRAFSPGYLQGPGIDLFLAGRDGEVMSCVQTTRAGSVVGIWAMATSPNHQRKGAGRALLNYVISYHHARGVEHFYLEAMPAGKPLYTRIGFKTVSDAEVWLYRP